MFVWEYPICGYGSGAEAAYVLMQNVPKAYGVFNSNVG